MLLQTLGEDFVFSLKSHPDTIFDFIFSFFRLYCLTNFSPFIRAIDITSRANLSIEPSFSSFFIAFLH